MSQNVAVVTWYPGRRKRIRGPGDNDEFVYEVWCIGEWRPLSEIDCSAQQVGTADELGARLRASVAEVAAGRVEGMVWKVADDLSEEQAADLIAGLPDELEAIAGKPLDSLAKAAGIPAPVAGFGADVMVAFLGEPFLGPLEKAVHAVEVVGLAVALLTGLHPLAVFFVQHLAHDELGSVLAAGFEKLMSCESARAVDNQPSELGGFATRLSSAAAVSDPASLAGSEPKAIAAASHEDAATRPELATVSGWKPVITSGSPVSSNSEELLKAATGSTGCVRGDLANGAELPSSGLAQRRTLTDQNPTDELGLAAGGFGAAG